MKIQNLRFFYTTFRSWCLDRIRTYLENWIRIRNPYTLWPQKYAEEENAHFIKLKLKENLTEDQAMEITPLNKCKQIVHKTLGLEREADKRK